MRQLQDRSEAYKNAMLLMSDAEAWKESEVDRAALVSRNVLGKESLLIGSLLFELADVVLGALKEVIEELEVP